MNKPNYWERISSDTLLSSTEAKAELRKGGPLGRRRLLVPRQHCLFKGFDLSGVAPKERPGALAIRIEQWSPYEQTGVYLSWQGAYAMAWCWDSERHLPLSDGTVRNPPQPTPETLLRGQPIKEGTRLVRCNQGVEGQLWKNGELRASHWWSAPPHKHQWQRFTLGAGFGRLDSPEVIEPPLTGKPWASNSASGAAGRSTLAKKIAWWALAGFFFAIGWELSDTWALKQQIQRLQDEATTLSTEIDDILQSRQQAQDAADRVRRYAGLATPVPQMRLLEQILEKLSLIPTARLSGWDYQSGKLQLLIQGERLDPSALIRKLQEIEVLQEVRAAPTRQPEFTEVTAVIAPPEV